MVSAFKLQLQMAEAAAAAAAAEAEQQLRQEKHRTAAAAAAGADVAQCHLAERDLWQAARDTFLDRLLSEWRFAACQVLLFPMEAFVS